MHPHFLKCPSNETISNCPICDSDQIPSDDWPQAGTHIFTIPYKCGTEIDYPIGHEGATYGSTCDGKVKRYVLPEITPEAIARFKEFEREAEIKNQFKYKKFYTPGMKLENLKNGGEIEEYFSK